MTSRTATATLALLAALFIPLAQLVRADAPPAADVPTKVAVCSTLKVITQIQEFKDLQAKVKADQDSLKAGIDQRQSQIDSLDNQIKVLQPDSPQYVDLMQQEEHLRIDSEVWAKVTAQEQARTQKQRTRGIFVKTWDAVSKIAKDKGYTVVISDIHAELPDNLDNIAVNDINGALVQRTILYADPKLDITQDVVVAMDKAYLAK